MLMLVSDCKQIMGASTPRSIQLIIQLLRCNGISKIIIKLFHLQFEMTEVSLMQ